MDSSGAPRACFNAEPQIYAEDPGALPKAIAALLHSQAKKTPFLQLWTIEIPMQGEGVDGFSVGMHRSRNEKGEWVLMVAPPAIGSLLGFWRGGCQARSTPHILQVCRQIHSAITQMRGVSALRWYFQTSGSRPVAVWTPDELLRPADQGH